MAVAEGIDDVLCPRRPVGGRLQAGKLGIAGDPQAVLIGEATNLRSSEIVWMRRSVWAP